MSNEARFTCVMSQEVSDRLERLRTETNAASMSEVFRRALAVYDHLMGEKKAGGTIIVRTDGKEKELVLL